MFATSDCSGGTIRSVGAETNIRNGPVRSNAYRRAFGLHEIAEDVLRRFSRKKK